MAVKSSKNTIAGSHFRASLKRWANESGKKKNELAAGLGLSPSNFGDYLHGVKSPSLAVMEEIAEKIGKDLGDMLVEGRAILEEGAAPQTGENIEAEFTPEQRKAIEAFKKCLKFGGEAADMLAKNAIELASKKQADSGFLSNTEKRRSA